MDRPPLGPAQLLGIAVPAGGERLKLAEGAGIVLEENAPGPRHLEGQQRTGAPQIDQVGPARADPLTIEPKRTRSRMSGPTLWRSASCRAARSRLMTRCMVSLCRRDSGRSRRGGQRGHTSEDRVGVRRMGLGTRRCLAWHTNAGSRQAGGPSPRRFGWERNRQACACSYGLVSERDASSGQLFGLES